MPTYPRTATATIELRGGDIFIVPGSGNDDEVLVAAGGIIAVRAAPNSKLRAWSILWQAETPCEDGAGSASGKGPGRKLLAIGEGANGGGTGEKRYKFAVMATDGTRVYFKDPDVVVGPQDGP